jgi:hypothetical protein
MREFRLLAVLVVVLGLGVVPVAAAPVERGAGPVAHRPVGFFDSLGRLLVSFLTKEGCGMDPLGHCATGTVTTDAGCGMDPWGHCATSTVTPKAGCRIDPWGRCIVGPATDAGCRIDPLGGGCTPDH